MGQAGMEVAMGGSSNSKAAALEACSHPQNNSPPHMSQGAGLCHLQGSTDAAPSILREAAQRWHSSQHFCPVKWMKWRPVQPA